MKMYSFIISNRYGQILDFGTYHSEQCARDTANDSPARKGAVVTIVNHDEDGNNRILD